METKARGRLDTEAWGGRTPVGAERDPTESKGPQSHRPGGSRQRSRGHGNDTGLHESKECTLCSEGIRVALLCEAAECHPQACEDLGSVPATGQ